MNSNPFEKHEIKLLAILEAVTGKIKLEHFGLALNDLSDCEDILSSYPNTSDILSLAVFHNFSLCYQRMRDFQMSEEYLKKSLEISEKMQTSENQFLNAYVKRYEILRTLQMCSTLSFAKNHSAALKFAKKAVKEIHRLFECISNLNLKYGKKTRGKKENFDSQLKAKRIIERVVIGGTESGLVLTQDWAYSYSMGNIMTIQTFQMADWTKQISIKTVTSLPFVSKIVFLLVGCYFTLATETRILDSASKEALAKSKEIYLKSLGLCKTFFPPASSLTQHVQSSIKKHCKPGKKEEKKPVISVQRIYTKRNSEKPRNTSEKSSQKTVHPKITPPRKLTPCTRVSSKIPSGRLKKIAKEISSREILKYSSGEVSKSSTMFREFDLRLAKRNATNNSESESFDCNF